MLDRQQWLVLGALWLCLPVVCLAQSSRSHRILRDGLPDPRNIEGALKERLEKASRDEQRRDLVKLFRDQELLKQLTPEQLRFLDANSDKIEALLQNEQFLDLLKESMAARKSDGRLTDQQIEMLKKLADSKLDPNALPPAPAVPAPAPEAAKETTPEQQPETEAGELDAADTVIPPDNGTESWFQRQWKNLTNSVMDELTLPENSAALENALRDLGGIQPGADGREEFNASGLWKGASEDAASWLTSRWKWPGELAESTSKLYRNARVGLPQLGGSFEGVLSRLPAGPAPSADGGSIQALSGAVLALALAVLGWKWIEKRAGTRAKSPAPDLGPWPVKPQAVASREDLIGAFEYLATLRLGAEGRTTNHRAVASRLSESTTDDSQRAAAHELARLYERARYEPAPRELDESAVAAARRDLTLLSGVAAA